MIEFEIHIPHRTVLRRNTHLWTMLNTLGVFDKMTTAKQIREILVEEFLRHIDGTYDFGEQVRGIKKICKALKRRLPEYFVTHKNATKALKVVPLISRNYYQNYLRPQTVKILQKLESQGIDATGEAVKRVFIWSKGPQGLQNAAGKGHQRPSKGLKNSNHEEVISTDHKPVVHADAGGPAHILLDSSSTGPMQAPSTPMASTSNAPAGPAPTQMPSASTAPHHTSTAPTHTAPPPPQIASVSAAPPPNQILPMPTTSYHARTAPLPMPGVSIRDYIALYDPTLLPILARLIVEGYLQLGRITLFMCLGRELRLIELDWLVSSTRGTAVEILAVIDYILRFNGL
ncbi:hypothetical protein BJ165DRAFT_1410382 [Panaeolus papilionaceus]|nr:hypothetical protein BJ165DRAFT_1410382 [Panaeolus papilionaceus]